MNNKKVVSINKYNYDIAARREQLRKEHRKQIRSNILIGIAGINMFLMMTMMISAIFIDYTNTEKRWMIVMITVAGICLILEDPKATINFIKNSFIPGNIYNYLCEEEDDE